MASAIRSDLSEAKIQEYEAAGRGNQDPDIIIPIAATPAGFTFEVPSTWTFNNTTSILTFTIPQPVGPNFTISVVNDRALDPAPTLTVRNGSRTGSGAVSNLVSVIDASTQFSASAGTGDNSRLITVTNEAGGVVTLTGFTVVATAVTGLTTPAYSTTFNGIASSFFNDTVFSFTGPFTNVNPNKDALQGLSIVARAIDTFLNAYSDSGFTQNDITGAIAELKARLDTAFPAASELPGISPTVPNQLSKITLKGSRRPSSGLLGRDGKTINNIFVNDAADFGLRQLTLRIYDSFIDILEFIENAGSTFTGSQAEAIKLLREFDVDFGELERSLGRNRSGDVRSEIPYDNTIVNGSGDQGMLVYADLIADIIASLSSATTNTYAALKTAVVAITSKERLLLKN